MENEIGFMVRDEKLKYAVYDNGNEMLIDLEKDPGEMVNIADHPLYKENQIELKDQILKHVAKSNIQEKD
jgi:choline-sulfatase